MCSISGITWSDRSVVDLMNKKQHKRGPDGSDILVTDNYTLGHTLLAINSDHGVQPLRGLGDLTFNGQIYDCPWEEELDSRWLLRHLDRQGTDFLKDTNGMWAFAYVRNGMLYLVRDHFGAKPLYFSIIDKGLIFASTIPALIETGLVDTSFCDESIGILEQGNYWQSGEITPYKYIKKLPPGGVYVWDLELGQFTSKSSLWEGFSLVNKIKYSHFDFRDKVLKAVQVVGNTRRDLSVLLSGGLDSTLIAGILQKTDTDFTAHTMGYQRTGDLGDRAWPLDEELEIAKHTCKELGIRHNIALFPENQELIDTLKVETIETAGTVLEDNYRMMPRYLLLEEVAARGGKVVLTGDGGDEIFTGYQLHRVWLEEGMPTSQDVVNYMEQVDITSWFPMSCVKGADAATALMFMKLLTQCETYLLRLDAFGGEHSLEVRVPLLYQDLVKYSMRLPLSIKLQYTDKDYKGINKYLIREAFADVIPDKVRYRKMKVGWSLPWWRNDMKKQRQRKKADRELLKGLI
jgi:asparagine synthase (glutamine-hydrolysing)